MYRKNKLLLLLFIILIFTCMLYCTLGLFGPSFIEAQNWAMMPPYNVLWPLWSPPLVTDFNWDPLVRLGTLPIITQLTKNTILPIQPCLVWDPCQPEPWPLYNTSPLLGSGLLYFDTIYGMAPWPPPYLLDPVTGAPAPITYITTLWPFFLPTSLGHLEYLIPLANLTYALTFGITGQPFLDLLSAAEIWGLPPVL